MNYDDRYGMTITKQAGGRYLCRSNGRTFDAPIAQRFDDTIDSARAVYETLEAFSDLTVKRLRSDPLTDPEEDPADRIRVDLEYARLQYALCRWKVPAYQALIALASGRERTALTGKRDYWVAQEAALRSVGDR